MEPGRKANKDITTRAGNGLSETGSSVAPSTPPLSVSASTPGNTSYVGEDESIHTLTGPGDGIPSSGGGQKEQKWGYVSPTGTRVEVDDTPGSEKVTIMHQSGSMYVIDPDGSIYVVSSSRKGLGIAAPYGDVYIQAAGRLILEAADMSIIARGNLTLDVGGTLSIKAKAIVTNAQVLDETIDGSVSRSVTDDVSTVVGGIIRETVAGDKRVQISGSQVTDVAGDDLHRITGNQATSVTGAMSHAAKGAATYHSDAKATLDGDGSVQIVGTTKVSGSLDVTGAIDSGSTIKGVGVVGSNVEVKGPIMTLASVGATSPDADDGFSGEIQAAETMDGEDIVDELTSERKYPNYPGNGKTESASTGSIMTVSHDAVDQAQEVYDEYSSANQGNLNPATPGEEIADATPVADNTSTKTNSPYSIPSKYDRSAKISRYFTLGDLIDAKHSHEIPAAKFDTIVRAHMDVAYNVLDPIKQQFSDMIITSAYRNNSKNHVTGQAIDFVCSSRSLAIHAEMARFAAEKTPTMQVFLEKNTSGRTHVHVRVGPAGSKPRVLSCGDPKCQSKTEGISIAYLRKKGVR